MTVGLYMPSPPLGQKELMECNVRRTVQFKIYLIQNITVGYSELTDIGLNYNFHSKN